MWNHWLCIDHYWWTIIRFTVNTGPFLWPQKLAKPSKQLQGFLTESILPSSRPVLLTWRQFGLQGTFSNAYFSCHNMLLESKRQRMLLNILQCMEQSAQLRICPSKMTTGLRVRKPCSRLYSAMPSRKSTSPHCLKVQLGVWELACTAHDSQLCMYPPTSVFKNIMLVTWNGSWLEYLHNTN